VNEAPSNQDDAAGDHKYEARETMGKEVNRKTTEVIALPLPVTTKTQP
jgi:hypothetical protein